MTYKFFLFITTEIEQPLNRKENINVKKKIENNIKSWKIYDSHSN